MEPYEYQTLFEFESTYWWYQGLHAILLDTLKSLPIGVNSTVLDAGCGTGKNLVNIVSRLTQRTFGFDFSSHTAPFWSQRSLKHVCLASINDIPFSDNTFDAVLSIDVLESDDVNEERAFRELWRVVRPGGFIILIVPAHRWLLSAEHQKAVRASKRYNKQMLRSLFQICPSEAVRLTYLFASVFPAVATYRLATRCFSRNLNLSSPRSELRYFPSIFNKILCRIVDVERRLLKRMDMPFGSSLLAVVRKNSATISNQFWRLGSIDGFFYRAYDYFRKKINHTLVPYLIDNAVSNENSKILEAGSGPGFGSSLFSKSGRILLSVALDIDERALQVARKQDPKLQTVKANLYKLPFDEKTFDLVWNSSTLEHFDDHRAVLKQMERVTRRGGYVFVGVPYLYGPLFFQRWIAKTRIGVWLGTVFDRKKLCDLFSSAGLRVVGIRVYFFHFFIGILGQKL